MNRSSSYMDTIKACNKYSHEWLTIFNLNHINVLDTPGCTSDGQYMLHPSNRCKFIRCTYSPQPRNSKGIYGHQFVSVTQECPYGTSVPRALYRSGYTKQLFEQGAALCADRKYSLHGVKSQRSYDHCSGQWEPCSEKGCQS